MVSLISKENIWLELPGDGAQEENIAEGQPMTQAVGAGLPNRGAAE